MAQIKKEAIRTAILDAAGELFVEKGYISATIPQIAMRAGVAPSSVYVYFSSKLEIVYEVYTPWFKAKLEALECAVSVMPDRRAALTRIIATIWQEIPRAENGFAINLMQALASATQDGGYDPGLLQWTETRLAGMLMRVLSSPKITRSKALTMAHIIIMSFDGFALSARIHPSSLCSDAHVTMFVDMLFAPQRAERGATGATMKIPEIT
ncbi:TetR/AcrR family transcriptional regulator [Beijerinckia sp. L45]|uniref:TetR/AcrR family transcriptional regulator n=1 Tax=Beijerinckia sp. L45 TaxID=1641855 RepID=UPI00131D1129|nr:TetR/AcrR family transcriptional regulator [Beijerinckia sp. L45]